MKTIEAAIEHFNTITLPGINTGRDVFINVKKEVYKDAFLEAFIAGVEFAQRWISVDEELPEIGQLVLVKNKSGDISTARRGMARFVIDFFDMRGDEITHWRCIKLK